MSNWYAQNVTRSGSLAAPPREIAPGVWATGPIRHTFGEKRPAHEASASAYGSRNTSDKSPGRVLRAGTEAALNATARGAGTPTDANAYRTVQQIAGLTEPERQYLLAVARGEGYYGLGWSAGNGKGSHNWGAVQGSGSAGSFQHLDHHADGTPYTTAFKAYRTDAEGASDMARILLKPNVKAILNKNGSLHDAVYQQHANGYFELAPDKYLAAVSRNYGSIAGMFQKAYLSEQGKAVLAVGLGLAALAGAVGGAAFFIARRRLA